MGRLQQRWMGAAVLLLGLTLSLYAQVEQPEDTSGDDPNRGAARISAIQGDVNVKRGDSGEVVAAVLNAPLMTQDQLQTAGGSRSEVQFDGSNLVRLAPETELNFAVVAQGRYQLQLSSGTIIYRMLRDLRVDAEIDTPSISVRPRMPGIYRISVYGDGTTAVTVRQGQAEIYSPKGSQVVQARQTMLARGPSSDPEFQMEGEMAQDQFDGWSNDRDLTVEQAAAAPYVPPEVAGAGELGGYGTWVPSTYGTVWAPRVAAGWAPYQYGRWVWEDYYGWTWVDYDPWGWAPFHYGRWFWNGGYGWCWWPGAMGRRHYWRPALVGFFGFGAGGVGVGIGFGFGNVGWVALAPHEVWRPWYGRGWYGHGGYNNRVVVNNVFVHNVNIYNSFRNSRVNNSVAYMNANSFGQGTRGFYRGNGAQIRQASLVRGQLPLTPSRNSLAFSNRAPAGVANNFARSGQQHFFTHQRPPAMERASFSQQQQHMAQFQEHTLGVRPNFNTQQAGFARTNPRQNEQRVMPNGSPNTNAMQAQPGSHWNGQAGSGWRLAGQSAPQAAAQQSRGNGNASPANSWSRPQGNQGGEARQNRAPADSGWHRFGDPGASSYTRQGSPSTGNPGWHTFGAPGDFGRSRAPQNREPSRNSFGTPRQTVPSQLAEPMRMNPPIVHDRPNYPAMRNNPAPSPSYSRPSGGGFGSPRQPAPSQSFRQAEPMRMNPPIVRDRPNYPAMRNNSAPRPSYNRPSGGFGSPRMGGGGNSGGGSRPSGGNRGGGGSQGGGNHGGGGGGGHRR